ncbi:putative capsular polysaccharide synthesis family protein [Alkalicoccus halolimnae]|uniref:Capsular polysaccharide synthesis family protein n=1 Tax=Alkalicoccus halolimnae TaxID=1667239 RepID=A0AAJ8LUG0_9BACI|nr:putative capsular polysaccharide synthesis family protein [Alkalicoccus halolimnae]
MLRKIKYFNDTYRKNENLVLIHQMGKVGSTSITSSLKTIGFTPIHVHSFYSPLSTQMYKHYHSTKYYRSFGYRLRYFLRHQLVLRLLKSRKKLKIISLVREPVSRNMSMYFHAFHVPLMDINKHKDNRREENTNMEAFRNDFFKKFNHTYGVNWFHEEFQRAWGVNIYEYPFNREEGHTVIREGNLEILLLKMERLNDSETVIADFLDLPEFELKNDNMGSKKWYHAVYKEFKEKLHPKREYLHQLYESDYMSHFYTDDEKASYQEKYLQNRNDVRHISRSTVNE